MEPYKIKPEMRETWERWILNNTKDPYSFAATKAALDAMAVLDVGGTCEEAEKEFQGKELSGFLAGCAAQSIVTFSTRGEDFRVFWNEKWGERDSDGVVNPAIVTIKTKGDENGNTDTHDSSSH